VSVTHCTCQIC